MAKENGLEYEYEVYPRFEDTDAYGIMHHSRYLLFVEEAKLAFMKDSRFFNREIMTETEKFLMTELKIQYIRAVEYSAKQPLVVKLRFIIIDEVKIRFDFSIYNKGRIACKGYAEHVVTDEHNQILFSLPEYLIQRYQQIREGCVVCE